MADSHTLQLRCHGSPDHPDPQASTLQRTASPSAVLVLQSVVKMYAEPWARRFHKREAAVRFSMTTPEFLSYIDRGEEPFIPMPNPWEITITKRGWECRVQEWRAALRRAFRETP